MTVMKLVVPSHQVNDALVKALENLLAKARSGELQGFGYGAVLSDESIQTAVFPGNTNHFSLLGAIEHARLRHYHGNIESAEKIYEN